MFVEERSLEPGLGLLVLEDESSSSEDEESELEALDLADTQQLVWAADGATTMELPPIVVKPFPYIPEHVKVPSLDEVRRLSVTGGCVLLEERRVPHGGHWQVGGDLCALSADAAAAITGQRLATSSCGVVDAPHSVAKAKVKKRTKKKKKKKKVVSGVSRTKPVPGVAKKKKKKSKVERTLRSAATIPAVVRASAFGRGVVDTEEVDEKICDSETEMDAAVARMLQKAPSMAVPLAARARVRDCDAAFGSWMKWVICGKGMFADGKWQRVEECDEWTLECAFQDWVASGRLKGTCVTLEAKGCTTTALRVAISEMRTMGGGVVEATAPIPKDDIGFTSQKIDVVSGQCKEGCRFKRVLPAAAR